MDQELLRMPTDEEMIDLLGSQTARKSFRSGRSLILPYRALTCLQHKAVFELVQTGVDKTEAVIFLAHRAGFSNLAPQFQNVRKKPFG